MKPTLVWTEEEAEVCDLVFEDGEYCVDCPYYEYSPGGRYEPPYSECGIWEARKHPSQDCLGYEKFLPIYRARQ